MTKVLIIGLDGATFSVIKPLCYEGKLPTLKELLAQGVHGTLESTFPPVTGPAWTALATGKNPGKTGIFDSLNRVTKESFETRVMSSADIRRARAYWDYLSNAGVRVGVVNYPFLYPPYELNGIMGSGLGSNPQDEIFYPTELKQSLTKECGDYRISVPWSGPKYTQNTSLLIKDILELLELNHKTLKFLLQADLKALTFVISASDFAQHYMWKYIDPCQPYYQKEESGKYRTAFVEIWQRIDDILGAAVEALPQNANVLIVSDHGFGPHQSSFYINSWLKEEGYLFSSSLYSNVGEMLDTATRLLSKIPYLYNKLAALPISRRLVRMRNMLPLDMERTLAFSPVNASLTGEICINSPAVSHYGKSQNIESVRDEIIQKLKKTCHGLGLHLKVYSPDDLYSGQYLNLAPDILFEIDDFECSIHFGFHPSSFQRPPDNPVHSGIHKKDGIFIAYGRDIRQGATIEGAKIYDIAPTILHMLSLPVPADMDGKALTEIFREGSEPAQREVRYQEVDVEQERVKDRIRKLKKSKQL